jgi:hypothetical protein
MGRAQAARRSADVEVVGGGGKARELTDEQVFRSSRGPFQGSVRRLERSLRRPPRRVLVTRTFHVSGFERDSSPRQVRWRQW